MTPKTITRFSTFRSGRAEGTVGEMEPGEVLLPTSVETMQDNGNEDDDLLLPTGFEVNPETGRIEGPDQRFAREQRPVSSDEGNRDLMGENRPGDDDGPDDVLLPPGVNMEG